MFGVAKNKKNMKKQKLKLAIMVVAMGMAAQSQAAIQTYDLTFNQTGESDQYGNATPPSVTDAVGQLNVDNGIAISGTLSVLSGPDKGSYNLVAGTGNDGVFAYDNIVFPQLQNGGFLDSTAGLLWSVTGVAGNSSEMNMWYNPGSQFSQPAGSYSLWGAPPTYNPEAYGIATLVAAPEPVSTTQFAGLSALGLLLVTMRRKFSVAG
jgi:hypothetical protein